MKTPRWARCCRRSEVRTLLIASLFALSPEGRSWAEAPVRAPLSELVLVPLPLGKEPYRDLEEAATALLDLRRLGAGAVLLSPLFSGTSVPPHAVVDHLQIEAGFGGEPALHRFLAAAAAAGLSVVVELHANDVSTEHEWFRAAQGGDRFHRRLFVLQAEPPERPNEAHKRPLWSFDEALKSHYYHAAGPGYADLDLTDDALRARIMGIAAHWHQRGVDGFAVLGARTLFEDGPRRRYDRPRSLAFFTELRARLPPSASIIAVVRANAPIAAGYFGVPDDGADLVLEQDRIVGFEDAAKRGEVDLLLAAIVRSEGVRPNASTWSVRAPSGELESSPLTTAFLLTAGGQPWLPVTTLRTSESRALIGLRGLHPALVRGAFEPLSGGPPGVLAFSRRDGLDEVLVLLCFGEERQVDLTKLGRAPGRLDLPAAVLSNAELDQGAKLVRMTRGGFLAVPITPPDFPLEIEMRPSNRAPSRSNRVGEAGVPFDERRGSGFDVDRRRNLSCDGGRPPGGEPNCVMSFEGGPKLSPGTRYTVRVPVAAYAVEVMTRGRPSTGRVLVEGEPATAEKRGFRHLSFVRDGQLSIEAAPESKTPVSRILITRVELPEIALESVFVGRSVTIRSPVGGEILWRMDESTTEPVESTALAKDGGRFQATLGPWPEGVSAIRLLVRDAKGRLYAGRSGAEIVLRRPETL